MTTYNIKKRIINIRGAGKSNYLNMDLIDSKKRTPEDGERQLTLLSDDYKPASLFIQKSLLNRSQFIELFNCTADEINSYLAGVVINFKVQKMYILPDTGISTTLCYTLQSYAMAGDEVINPMYVEYLKNYTRVYKVIL